jgi:signal transduction histidine kinase
MARELLTETLVHDLRSPVGAVKTTLELIEEAIPKDQRDPVTDQSLDIAARSADRVLSLVESMLDISQLESGNVDLITQPTQIDALIRSTIKELVPVANEDGIVLRHEDSKTLPPVMIDQELIRRVLTNLIDNALKFTPEGGVITISARAEKGGGVTTRVSDTGPGIPKAYYDKVFTRFGQVPGLRGRRRGSGLGLTFCRLAVEAHGGRIWIEPSSNKGGATLAFTLPAAK